jgi:hypothetical protein
MNTSEQKHGVLMENHDSKGTAWRERQGLQTSAMRVDHLHYQQLSCEGDLSSRWLNIDKQMSSISTIIRLILLKVNNQKT